MIYDNKNVSNPPLVVSFKVDSEQIVNSVFLQTCAIGEMMNLQNG